MLTDAGWSAAEPKMRATSVISYRHILYPLTPIESGTIDNLGIGVGIFNIDQIECNIHVARGK